MRKIAVSESSEVAQQALDVAAGKAVDDRRPITKAEAAAVLKRFRLIDLLNLVIVAAASASDGMAMTVESTAEPQNPKDRAVRVVVRVTRPRAKKVEEERP